MLKTWLTGFLLCVVVTADAGEREVVQGQGGRFLSYSSTQILVTPTEEELDRYKQARDLQLRNITEATALQAGEKALQQLGYQNIDIDTRFGLISAEKNERLVSQAREVLRGLLKMRMPLPGKPDHQTTALLMAVRPAPDGNSVIIRTKMQRTVWDSNGNSRTSLSTDMEAYHNFYQQLESYLVN